MPPARPESRGGFPSQPTWVPPPRLRDIVSADMAAVCNVGEMFFERLGHFVIRRRRWIVSIWILSLLVGFVSASQIGKRWFESFSIPGYSAYASNQRTLKTFGNGEQAPLVAVFRSNGDVTKERGIVKAIAAAA